MTTSTKNLFMGISKCIQLSKVAFILEQQVQPGRKRSALWTVPATGHKKGGDIQGIRTASAAGAETLSDALGTRLAYLGSCLKSII